MSTVESDWPGLLKPMGNARICLLERHGEATSHEAKNPRIKCGTKSAAHFRGIEVGLGSQTCVIFDEGK